jgi:hypothetical protein
VTELRLLACARLGQLAILALAGRSALRHRTTASGCWNCWAPRGWRSGATPGAGCAGDAPDQAVRAAPGELAGEARDERDEPPACPSCGAALPAEGEDCPACTREQQAPTSTWVLLRLWRFARPYRKQLFTGFALTLASTAATLVPPYLTIPLMDKMLIPFQNGQQIDPMLVLLYLSGLLGSALRPGAWAGRAPTSWPWCPSASAPTCAPPPTSTCCACRWITSAASAPAT